MTFSRSAPMKRVSRRGFLKGVAAAGASFPLVTIAGTKASGRVIEAARKYGRMLQHGTQQRSDPRRASEIAAVQSGKYGKLLVSKGYCCKPRWSIGRKEITTPPADLDFNLWVGPAPEQPYHGN